MNADDLSQIYADDLPQIYADDLPQIYAENLSRMYEIILNFKQINELKIAH